MVQRIQRVVQKKPQSKNEEKTFARFKKNPSHLAKDQRITSHPTGKTPTRLQKKLDQELSLTKQDGSLLLNPPEEVLNVKRNKAKLGHPR